MLTSALEIGAGVHVTVVPSPCYSVPLGAGVHVTVVPSPCNLYPLLWHVCMVELFRVFMHHNVSGTFNSHKQVYTVSTIRSCCGMQGCLTGV